MSTASHQTSSPAHHVLLAACKLVLFLLLLVALYTSLRAAISQSTSKTLKQSLFRAYVHPQYSAYSSNAAQQLSSPAQADHQLPPSIALICNNTAYPQACLTGFTSQSSSGLKNATSQKIVSIALKAALAIVHESHGFAKTCSSSGGNGLHLLERQAAEDCIEMMQRASDQLNLAFSALSSLGPISSSHEEGNRDALVDLNVRLSASLSFQTTCADGFQFVSYGKCERAMLKRQEQVGEVLVNSLDMVKRLLMKQKKKAGKPHRHLSQVPDIFLLDAQLDGSTASIHHPFHMQQQYLDMQQIHDEFPEWVSSSERKLLQLQAAPAPMTSSPTGVQAAAPLAASIAASNQYNRVSADMVVAKDGSGDYANITDALNHIPWTSSWTAGKTRFVLYIRKGVYEEIVNVPKELTNLTLIGDGMGITVITGSNNVGSGLFNTLRTATMGVSGDGFMARDITFRNTAGPEGYQAVALRGSGDFMVFYRCSFEGYQDTLYALASRHFYRDCIIQGTVDFIFGNAIASFQNCRLQARRPLRGQQNTLTAQGRKIDVDISGFSFQNCTLEATPELASSPFPVASYLGRPWKPFSRTVFLQCFFDSLIHPAGWLPWNSSNPFTDTLFYGEFQNRGPGSPTANRVPWKGVHPVMNSSDAASFTADNFILGSAWLPLSQVDYTSGLL